MTQRGNRRQPVFFEPSDYAPYRGLVAEHCRKASVHVWTYCLMLNHVHLVTPPVPDRRTKRGDLVVQPAIQPGPAGQGPHLAVFG